MFETITNYNDIILKKNSLLIFDIDETIMKFDGINSEWWKNKFDYYYKNYNDYDKADDLTLKEWINHIHLNKAELIDRHKFFDKLYKAHHEYNCEIIFITARNINLKDITEKHFTECDISDYIHKIYYDENKGLLLKQLLKDKYKNHKHVIFIDDNKRNLEEVYNENKDTHELSLYLFNY
jgi:FMN phosphatase YigB (HAD superfamily)